VHAMPLDSGLSPELDVAVCQINSAMESLVLRGQDQYLWGYARYKSPRAEA
jgi:KDO2-lipid IV(A) lauroyltransferase